MCADKRRDWALTGHNLGPFSPPKAAQAEAAQLTAPAALLSLYFFVPFLVGLGSLCAVQ